MAENTIPILPCRDLASVLDFYTALGFTVTFQQRSPNPYGVVERGDIHLHFFGMKGYDPKSSYSTCYVQTTDVDGLHTEFRAALRAAYGRNPLRGLPRIGPLKTTSHGTRQFLMSDPGGNCVRVGQRVSEVVGHRRAPTGIVARALHHAELFADSRDDPTSAAAVLDRALRSSDELAPADLLRLLALRADVAFRLEDDATARSLLGEVDAIRLNSEERAIVHMDLDRLAELRDQL